MDSSAAARLGLVYVHLLLCVFALHTVLSTDLRVLRKRIGAAWLMAVHRRVALLLAGLWVTGLAIVAVDVGGDFALVAERPKLLVKLLCVSTLTANAFALRLWCFPRLLAERRLDRSEIALLMTCGAISTSSWLVAAFLGIARPLQELSFRANVAIYAAAVCAAVLIAVLLGPSLHTRRPRAGNTALERAAETLELRTR
jgi:hypothetical protein